MLDVNEPSTLADSNAWSSRFARYHDAGQTQGQNQPLLTNRHQHRKSESNPASQVVDETRKTLIWNRLEALRLKELGLEQTRKFDLKRRVNRSQLYYGDQPAWTAGLPTLRLAGGSHLVNSAGGNTNRLTSSLDRGLTLQSLQRSNSDASLGTVSQLLREQTKRHLAEEARVRALTLSNNRVSPFITLEQPDPEASLNDTQSFSPRKDFRKLRLDATGVIPCNVTSWRSNAIIPMK